MPTRADLYRVQKDAVARGVKYLFIVWFDGMDWESHSCRGHRQVGQRSIRQGEGVGPDFPGLPRPKGQPGSAFMSTSPTHDKNKFDLDAQTVTIPSG